MRAWALVGIASTLTLIVSCGGRSTAGEALPDASIGTGGSSDGTGGHGTGGGTSSGGTGGYGTGGGISGGTGGYGAGGGTSGGSGGYGAGGSGGHGSGGGPSGSGGGPSGSGGGPSGSCGGAICGPPLVCINGQCRCPPPQKDCGGICADLSSDPQHCGGCGVKCVSSCTLGKCDNGGTCNPAFCPSAGVGFPCCVSASECGVDYGMGCVPAYAGDAGP